MFTTGWRVWPCLGVSRLIGGSSYLVSWPVCPDKMEGSKPLTFYFKLVLGLHLGRAWVLA